MKKLLMLFLPLLSFASIPAHAHHSFSMFSHTEEKVHSGTVERWAYNNPHSWLYVNVANEDGTETLWGFEGSAPPRLVGRGITGLTFRPGDKITIMYCPLVDGRPGGAMGWARLEDGTYIDPSDGGCDGSPENAARWEGLMEQGITSSDVISTE